MSTSALDALVEKSLITKEQAAAALAGGDAIQRLIASGALTEAQALEVFSKHFSIATVKLVSISTQALNLLPLGTILKFRCLPYHVDTDGKTVRVAIADPTDLAHVEIMGSMLGRSVTLVPMLTTFSTLDAAIKAITNAEGSGPRQTQPAPEPAAPPPQSTRARAALGGRAVRRFRAQDPVVNILNQILVEAVSKGASDVHIEPQADRICVRYRYEGALFDVFEVPGELKEQLSNRVKVTTGLDISERRLPQDGRARLRIGDGEVSFRASVMPTMHGENIVFRILKQSDMQIGIEKLGLDPRQFAAFRKGLLAPNGMLLVTGPTGSGKTSTLYSALAALNEREVKIATVEDPVECTLPGTMQVQVSKESGLDFAEVLKSLLRQDPDIILVGEIRDQETAAIAVQAALTGHLVLSSLHTNDAASAVVRLLNMKVEPFAVLAAINTVVAQRLVRRVCSSCAEPTRVSQEQMDWLGADAKIIAASSLLRGRGCELCLGGGYRGRVAIFEVLELDETLKEMFLKGENLIDVKRHAIARGTKTLRQSALTLAAAGATTVEEAIASTLGN